MRTWFQDTLLALLKMVPGSARAHEYWVGASGLVRKSLGLGTFRDRSEELWRFVLPRSIVVLHISLSVMKKKSSVDRENLHQRECVRLLCSLRKVL